MTNEHDLARLMKFAKRREWRGAFEAVLAEHLMVATQAFELETVDLAELLGADLFGNLWGCAFEDFLSRPGEGAAPNVVDAYLERHGKTEVEEARRYMASLRGSRMSLYEVREVDPGRSFRAHDLIRGGADILVHERSATRSLAPGQRVAARLMPAGEASIMSGGILPFGEAASERFLHGLRDAGPGDGRPARDDEPMDDDALRRAAPLFTAAWLLDVLPGALGDASELRDSEGERPVLHRFCYPLAKGVRQSEIAERFADVAALRSVRARVWDWVGEELAADALDDAETGRIAEGVTLDGRVILGHAELEGRFLNLTTNSVSRAARARTLLADVLGARIGEPTLEVQTLDDIADDSHDGREDALAADDATAIVHRFLDGHYRETLDASVPMLGGLSPRAAAAAGGKSRAKVIEWLEHLERGSASRADPADPMATYDFGWMWRELSLERRRS